MVVLGISTVRFRIGSTYAEAFILVSRRQTETVAISFFVVVTVIFALVLSSKVQTFNQTEEVGVTIGCNAGSTLGHEYVGLGPGITTKLRQDVGPCADVVSYAVVTTVVERTVFSEFQASECQTGFVCFGTLAFGTVAFEFIFPLTKTNQLVVDLSFAFEAQTCVGFVAIAAGVVREVMLSVNFTVDIQFVCVFVIYLSCVYRTCRQQASHCHCN